MTDEEIKALGQALLKSIKRPTVTEYFQSIDPAHTFDNGLSIDFDYMTPWDIKEFDAALKKHLTLAVDVGVNRLLSSFTLAALCRYLKVYLWLENKHYIFTVKMEIGPARHFDGFAPLITELIEDDSEKGYYWKWRKDEAKNS